MPQLVLASTSPYRRALLARLGLSFAQVAPHVDEALVKLAGLPPMQTAQALAARKAAAVAQSHRDCIVIGSDQIAAIDGLALDKPGNLAAAQAQLQRLRGRQHELFTAVCLQLGEQTANFVDVTRLCMRELDDGEIDRYLAVDQPFDCAGSYKLESLGISLFHAIDSEDQTAVTGLPLLRLAAELRQFGLRVP